MEDFNTYEYAATQKSEGKWKTRRILLLLAYVLFTAVYFVVIFVSKFIPLGALIPVFLWILVFLTWRYVKPDYKYVIEKGTLTFYVAYGNNKKKKTLKPQMKFKVSTAEAIAPRAEIEAMANALAGIKTYSAIPSVNAADQYGALYKDETGSYCVFYFVATSQGLKLLRFYNSKTVVTQTAI